MFRIAIVEDELPISEERPCLVRKRCPDCFAPFLQRPDGSRVLLLTVRVGGAVVRTMSLKISEPADISEGKGQPSAAGEKDAGAGKNSLSGAGGETVLPAEEIGAAIGADAAE